MATVRKVSVVGELNFSQCRLSEARFNIDGGRLGHMSVQDRECRAFTKRREAGKAIYLSECLYPLMQGRDSVEIHSDVELGGSDQKFNLLVGREIQRDFGQLPQIIATTPLLEGLDGVNKMSKSLGNYIGINEPSDEIFGKVMSISDELMWRYYELLSFLPENDIARYKKEVAEGRNPRDIKVALAQETIAGKLEVGRQGQIGQVPSRQIEVLTKRDDLRPRQARLQGLNERPEQRLVSTV